MPKIPLLTLDPRPGFSPFLRIEESIQQDSLDASVPLTPGPVRIVPATGEIARAKADNDANARTYGLIVKKVPGKCAATVIRRGVVYGYNFAGVNYGDPIYLDNDGDLSTTPGTQNVVVGRVIAFRANPKGTPNDKALSVEL